MSRSADDAGLATERTALAWQRTALSLIVACAIMVRLTWPVLGLTGICLLFITTMLSTWLVFVSRTRNSLDAGTRERRRTGGGRAPLALAAAMALIATIELAALGAKRG